jgi:hypothetical protein
VLFLLRQESVQTLKYNITIIQGNDLVQMMEKAFPSDNDEGHIKIMCRECGIIVTSIISEKESTVVCEKGHSVRVPSFDTISALTYEEMQRLGRKELIAYRKAMHKKFNQ